MASMLRHASLDSMDEFIKENVGSVGLFVDYEEKMENYRRFDEQTQKLFMVRYILYECQKSNQLSIRLQDWFGQFDGAQICENCGEIMWSGYSIHGSTYCNLDCALNGTNWELKQLAEELEHAEEIDCNCYYTEWF